MKYLKDNLGSISLGLLALLGWYGFNHLLGANFAAVVGPEFLTKLVVKLFIIALAGIVTFHVDHWVAPTIKEWCTKEFEDVQSNFRKTWSQNPNDQRLKICVFFYLGLFIGLCLVFSL